MIRVALRGLAGRKFRSALTALAVVLGVAMISGTYVLTDSISNAFGAIFDRSFAKTDAVVSGKAAFGTSLVLPPTLPESLLGRVRALPQVADAAGGIADSARLIDKHGKQIGGGGPPTLAFGSNSGRFSPLTVASGHWPTGPGQVGIDAGTASRHGFHVGDTIGVSARGPVQRFTIVGIDRFGGVASIGGATIAVFDVPTAQALFHKEGRLDTISVAARPGVAPKALVAAIEPLLPRNGQVRTGQAEARSESADIQSGVSILQKVLLAFGGIALFVGAFIIFNSLSITVAQRAREFALLRTIGASRRQVLGSVLVEAVVLGTLAAGAGLFAGLGLAKGLNAFFVAVGIDLPQAGLVFAPRTIGASFAIGIGITVLASLVPAIRATRVPPVAVLREGALVPRSRLAPLVPYLALVVIGLGVAGLSYGLFRHGIGVTPRLTVLGLGCFGLFIGVALLSPRLVRPLASVIGWPATRIGGVAGRLARENAMRNPGRTAVTASALMIGLTLVTFVAVFAQGLRHSVGQAIAAQLHTDYVVTSKDGFTPFQPGAARALARLPGVAVTDVRAGEGLAFGAKHNVTGLDTSTIGGAYHFDWVAGSDASLGALGRDGAVVDETFAKKHRLARGSGFALETPHGRTLHLLVRGIYSPPAFGSLLGVVNISTLAFDAAYSEQQDLYAFVSVPGPAGPSETAALERALHGFPDAKVSTQAAFVKAEQKGISQTLNILYVLLALSVVISLFGIVNTLVLSVFERTRELGMLRAIGTTRRQVRRMIRHESVITALIGAVLGIVVGVGLAALVTRALRDQGVVFSVPWRVLVIFAVVAALAGVLAAVLPARRASRLNVLEALQYE